MRTSKCLDNLALLCEAPPDICGASPCCHDECAGATKLIQYAHWERDRFKAEASPPPPLKLDLSDNCIADPAKLMEELVGKRIKLTSSDAPDGDATVIVPDFTEQRPPLPPPFGGRSLS